MTKCFFEFRISDHFLVNLSSCIRLARLDHNVFIRIAHAFALVGFRLLEAADAGGNFTDKLLVVTVNGDLRAVRNGHLDAFRDNVFNSVGITEVQRELVARQRGFVTDTNDLELFGVSLGNTDDHIVDKASCQTMIHSCISVVIATDNHVITIHNSIGYDTS